jgi:hypothetical protein
VEEEEEEEEEGRVHSEWLAGLGMVSPFLVCIGSPCLRDCGHGALIPIGGGAARLAEARAAAAQDCLRGRADRR